MLRYVIVQLHTHFFFDGPLGKQLNCRAKFKNTNNHNRTHYIARCQGALFAVSLNVSARACFIFNFLDLTIA